MSNYTYPSASELAEKLAQRRAAGGTKATAVSQAAPTMSPVVPVGQAGKPPEPAEDAKVAATAGLPEWLPAVHGRYLAGENVRILAGEVGMPWQRLLRLFADAGLPRRDGTPLGKAEFHGHAAPDDMFDTAGLAEHLGVSVNHASGLISGLPGAKKVKGKWLVPKTSAPDDIGYVGVPEFAEMHGLTQKAARSIIKELPTARRMRGRWVVLRSALPESLPEQKTAVTAPELQQTAVKPESLDDYFDVKGLAEYLGISPKTAEKKISALPGAFKFGNKWLVLKANVPAKKEVPVLSPDEQVQLLHAVYMEGAPLSSVATSAGYSSWRELVAEFVRLDLSKRDGTPWDGVPPQGVPLAQPEPEAPRHPANEPVVVFGDKRFVPTAISFADAQSVADARTLEDVSVFFSQLKESVEKNGGRLSGLVRLELNIKFGDVA